MKKKLAALLLSMLLLFTACGCKTEARPADSLVGTWKDGYGLTEYKFDSDGKMKIQALKLGSFKGTYHVDGDQITIQYRVLVKNVSDTYKLKLDGNTMYLDNNQFQRKK